MVSSPIAAQRRRLLARFWFVIPVGDFELTFSKGPGVNLLTMRTDPTFARVQGPLTRIPWSGPIQQPPARALKDEPVEGGDLTR